MTDDHGISKPTQSHILKLANVTRVFGSGNQSVTAVDNVSLQIKHGQFVALVGRSGSGKTTLMNIMSGLDNPTSGHVEFDGKFLTDMSDGELVKLRRNKQGFIFQSFGLISLLSAYENVQLPLHISGTSWRERRRKAATALEMVGLAGRANHRPYELSGGEQQRVAIARALVSEPNILFADEPTGELDSVNALYISQILKDISKTNQVTIIAATHDPTLADMSDQIYLMQDGAIQN